MEVQSHNETKHIPLHHSFEKKGGDEGGGRKILCKVPSLSSATSPSPFQSDSLRFFDMVCDELFGVYRPNSKNAVLPKFSIAGNSTNERQKVPTKLKRQRKKEKLHTHIQTQIQTQTHTPTFPPTPHPVNHDENK